MNAKIKKHLKLTLAASILGTSLLTDSRQNIYVENSMAVLDVTATQNR